MAPLLGENEGGQTRTKRKKTSAGCFKRAPAREAGCIIMDLHHEFSQNLASLAIFRSSAAQACSLLPAGPNVSGLVLIVVSNRVTG